MRLVAALLRGAFWFVLCVCVTHWSCVFCDCVPRLRSVFLYCVCVSRYPFVSASCVCILHFPTASPVTQSLCSLRDFFRCSLHRFLRSTVGFIPTRRTLSLTGRSVVALTHRSVSALSLLSYLYRLADLMACTPQIAPCLTWILSGLEFALCLVRSGVHQRPFTLLDVEGPLSEHDAMEDAFVHILTNKGGCEGGLAQALHMLDDDGILADIARWQTWTHCLVKLQAFRCHLGELLDQHTLELPLIANHLCNAHAYPHLLPHFTAAGLLKKSWSPPPERLLSLCCGAGPSDPVPAGEHTHIFSEFQGNCFHCGKWEHHKIHCPHYIPPRPHKSTKCPL